eukprot:13656714-Alexandrium_andersonii.AAC.1
MGLAEPLNNSNHHKNNATDEIIPNLFGALWNCLNHSGPAIRHPELARASRSFVALPTAI